MYIGILWQSYLLIKLTKFPVRVRFRCGSGKLKFCRHVTMRYLRTLYKVWSLVRRRDTRRLTRLQTMCTVFKYCKTCKNSSMRLRCGYFSNLLKTSTVTATLLLSSLTWTRSLVLEGFAIRSIRHFYQNLIKTKAKSCLLSFVSHTLYLNCIADLRNVSAVIPCYSGRNNNNKSL